MRRAQYILRPLALILALILGVSSIGVSMNMHICRGKVRSISFFGKAKTCLEMQADKALSGHCRAHKHCKHSGKKTKPCCHHKSKFSKLSLQAAAGSTACAITVPTDYSPAGAWLSNGIEHSTLSAERPAALCPTSHRPWSIPRDIYVLFGNFRL